MTLASLTAELVTADGTRVGSQGAKQDNQAGLGSQTNHSCSKAAAGMNLVFSRDVKESWGQEKNAGEGRMRGESG